MICPGCRQAIVPMPVGFTWWGGFIGAKIINHVECPSCKTRFNGKTGQSNDTNIKLYIAVVTAIVLAMMWLMYSGMRR